MRLLPPLAVAAALLASGCRHRRRRRPAPPRPHVDAHIEVLDRARLADHAYGRVGDLRLVAGGVALTVAARPDAPGHRPLMGAVVDVDRAADDRPDPLLWWRPTWVDAAARPHPMVAALVDLARCPNGSTGVVRTATVDGVSLRSHLCALGPGRFRVRTTARDLPQGASLADDINPGTAAVRVEGHDAAWEGTAPTAWVELTEHGTTLRFESSGATVAKRNFVHIASEAFPAPVLWTADGATSDRTLTVRDAEPDPVPSTEGRATLRLAFNGPANADLPVHVMFARTSGSDPQPTLAPTARGFASGRSVYLLDGHGDVSLPPGEYRVTASHGTAWTLHQSTVTLTTGAVAEARGSLRPVLPPDWIAADLHLHSTPSPDSRVTLAQRVASLACNGVQFAVATDHNRITDLAPAVHAAGLDDQLVTAIGDEVTSAGAPLWGHFNAYPLPAVPEAVAPEDAVPPYYNVEPAALFAGMRAAGASIVQVNHPRMPPSIGYFDLTGFDAATGRANEHFADGFNAVEAFNGIWLETPARVREGAIDLVGLARRGMRVAATGNSDSHRLVYEEAGYPRTWVHAEPGERATTGERVFAAIGRGETTVSSGPFVTLQTLTNGRDGVLIVRVTVTAPAWVPVEHVELWQDDRVAQRWTVTAPPVDGVRFESRAVLYLTGDTVVTAWADADAPLPDVLPYPNARAIGFTSPRYIDRDGDGRMTVAPRP
jgi:hypothetical protein